MPSTKKSLKCFISYSHIDMKYKNKLLITLKTLEQLYNIEVWHDGKIVAGQDIDKEVLNTLSCSDIIILLVTPNFLASSYCIDIELKKSIAKMNSGECIVVPVIFQESIITEDHSFYKLNRVPRDGKPINKYRTHLDGCTEATQMIKDMIDKFFPQSKKNGAKKTRRKNNFENIPLTIGVVKNGKFQPVYINQKFVDIIPKFTKNMIEFHIMMQQVVDQSIKRLKDKCKRADISKYTEIESNEFKLFLMDICGYIKRYITDPVGIRVHFRHTTATEYKGIVASTDKDDKDDLATDWSTDLTPIPITQGLIYYSAELKTSLLKSLNPKINYKGKNDNIWKEYLSHSFTNLNNGRQVQLSMGISVRKEYYNLKKELFLYLAYINFGEIVEKYIILYCEKCKKFDKNYNIENVIDNII